jgi:hypothetical protein
MSKDKEKKSYDNLIDTKQKSTIEKFTDEIKNLTFSVLYVLLKEEADDGNMLIFCLQTLFDYLQLIQFLFNDTLLPLWNSKDVFSQVFDFFAFFNISQYFNSVLTVELYLVIFYFFIFLILFILLDIIYVSISFKRKKFTMIWPLTFLRNFVNIAVTVLFLFITETLLTIVSSLD